MRARCEGQAPRQTGNGPSRSYGPAWIEMSEDDGETSQSSEAIQLTDPAPIEATVVTLGTNEQSCLLAHFALRTSISPSGGERRPRPSCPGHRPRLAPTQSSWTR